MDEDEIHPAAFRIKIRPFDIGDDDDPLEQTRRGEIVELGPGIHETDRDKNRWHFIQVGNVVHYTGWDTIGEFDYLLVAHEHILSWERGQ